jgi:hypothetical protein
VRDPKIWYMVRPVLHLLYDTYFEARFAFLFLLLHTINVATLR